MRKQEIDHYEFEDTTGYLHTEEFKLYSLCVLSAIQSGRTTIAEIKGSFESDHRWLMDALSELAGQSLVFQTRYIFPCTWIPSTPKPEKPKKKFNGVITPRTNYVRYGK